MSISKRLPRLVCRMRTRSLTARLSAWGLAAVVSFTTWPGSSVAAQTIQGPVSEVTELLEATHTRLTFDRDVVRYAVGSSRVLSVEVLRGRELLVLGERSGRTSLFVWFADGGTQTLLFSVQPDLSVLREALQDLHPSLSVETAPDRHVYVLRGLVPDVGVRAAAEATASAYLQAQQGQRRGAPPVVGEPGEDGEDAVALTGDNVRIGEDLARAAVLNLVRVEGLPPRADERMREALAPLSADAVTVRRITLGDLPDDSIDHFVLEGTVPDQVTLTRVLFLASRALLGERSNGESDIRVLADEAGGLADATNVFGSAAVGGGNVGQGNINLGGNQGAGGTGGGQNGGQQLANRIGVNLGRAKVIEAADGRILAMIEVENLPLVRVDVRLYEVNLTRLRQWRNDLGVAYGDFDQPALNPAAVSEVIQGSGAPSVGQDDVQNVLGFLDGSLSNQLQLVSGGLAVDTLFQLLVEEQVARSLSRPSLTVLSGELAFFQVGGQVPVPVALTVGGGTDQVLNSVEFVDFGIQLQVRPLVEELDSETITLDLQPVVSMPDLDLTAAIGAATGTTTNTTAFESRGVRTHTRLLDGEAMLVGGLISRRDRDALGRVPGLGDVPLAGALFRNEASDSEDLELVIVVNPVIVRTERPEARLWGFAESGDVLSACLEAVRQNDPQPDAEDAPVEGASISENREPEPN